MTGSWRREERQEEQREGARDEAVGRKRSAAAEAEAVAGKIDMKQEEEAARDLSRLSGGDGLALQLQPPQPQPQLSRSDRRASERRMQQRFLPETRGSRWATGTDDLTLQSHE